MESVALSHTQIFGKTNEGGGNTGDQISRRHSKQPKQAAALQVRGFPLCSVADKVRCCSFSAAKQKAVAVMALWPCCGNAEVSPLGQEEKTKRALLGQLLLSPMQEGQVTAVSRSVP